MKAPLSNFIPLNRNVFKHEFWLEKRAYSRFEAWLDLVASARFDNSEARQLIGSTVVRYERGELVASLRFLGERWGWGKTKVDFFLKLLKAEGMIKTKTGDETSQTIITICNYEHYNVIAKTKRQALGQVQDSNETAARQEQDKYNIDNKEQKSEQREIYRAFGHLVLFTDEYFKLIDAGHTKTFIDETLDAIQNYKNNKKYVSLFLTTKNWLQKNKHVAPPQQGLAGGRIGAVASAFQDALRY